MDPIQLDHIAIALPRIADAPPDLVGLLGGIPEHNQPGRAFRWASWTYAGGGRIEILEPVGADRFLRRFLASQGPAVHHVTFKVPSLAGVCERAEARAAPAQPDSPEAVRRARRAAALEAAGARLGIRLRPSLKEAHRWNFFRATFERSWSTWPPPSRSRAAACCSRCSPASSRRACSAR